MRYRLSEHLYYDVRAGVTVFLVAIPLCLGIALASDAPPIAGLLSGIIGGIIIGLLSGSHTSVSGPAAGLVAVVLSALGVLGSFQAFLLAVFFAGIIQFLLGIFRAGMIAHFIPSSVIKGMLAAIGVILIFKQLPHAVGYDTVYEGSLSFLQEDNKNTLSELLYLLNYLSPGAVIISLVSFFTLYVFSIQSLQKYKFFKYMPGALAAIVIAAVINQLFQAFIPDIALYETHLVTIPNVTFDNINEVLFFPDFSAITNPQVYKFAFIIAIIASIETLLCIEAADKLDPQKRVTPTGKELKAQGVGNILSGLVGGLPITSVIVRTSVNIENEAKSKLSTIIHGCLIVLSLLFAAALINQIPLASLAAILIVTGYKLSSEKLIRDMYRGGWGQFIPFAVTMLGVFFTNILYGVFIGLCVAIIFILKKYYDIQNFDFDIDEKNNKYKLTLSRATTFLSKSRIQKVLNNVPFNSTVVLDLRQAKVLDAEIKEVINDFIIYARSADINVEVYESDDNKLDIRQP